MATQSEILDILETLADIYGTEPGKPEAYFWTLEDYDGALVQQAVRRHVKSSKWFPKPSELVEACQREQAEQWDDVQDKRRLYWMAMSEYNEVLRGQVDGGILETSRAAAWCRRYGLSVGDTLPLEVVQFDDV